MVNNVVLVGRLVRDVDLRQTSTGKEMTYFTLAVNRNFKNEQGEQAADFISCVAFGKTAENMARFLSKGSLIAVEGRIPRSKNYKRLKELYESLISKEEKINKPDENKDSGLGQELLNKLAKADERLNKLASDQEVCYKNLAMVNAQITAWNHERHKLVKQLKELVGA